jgi:broad specificity phosphatase PhoE
MKLYLIRHGQTVLNEQDTVQGWHDSSLTEHGREQARAAAAQLEGTTPTIIFSSDLGRTQQTTDELRSTLGDIPVLFDWRLRERMMGDAEGKHHTQVDREELRGLKPNVAVKGMESLERFTDRVMHFISDLLDFADQHEEVVIVTHNGTINRFAYLTDRDKYQWKEYPNGDVLELELRAED